MEVDPEPHEAVETAKYIVKLPTSRLKRKSETRYLPLSRSPRTLLTRDSAREPSAAQKVLATVELLEMVLLHLPITTLFVVQQVNTTFNDTIKRSVHLRRAMFLENDPAIEASSKQITNPILRDTAFTPNPGVFLELITRTSCPDYRVLPSLVDFDVPYFTTPSSRPTRSRDKIWLGSVRESKKRWQLPFREDVMESWQKMLLKQGKPAKTSVRLWYRQGSKARPLDYAREKLRRRTTLGKIWKFIEDMH